MVRTFARAAFAAACVASLAHAQVGGLISKAAKSQIEASDKKDAKPLAGDPITAQTLDGVLRGLNVLMEGRAQVEKINATRDAKNTERSTLHAANNAAIDRWQESDNRFRSCISDAMSERAKLHEGDVQSRMARMQGDPAAMQRYSQAAMEFSQKSQALMAKGDTAGLKRAQLEFSKAMGVDVSADSAAAYQKCGRPQPKPAAMARIDQLAAEIDALNQQARAAEAQTDQRASAASGMPTAKFGLARERLLTWYSVTKKGGKKGAVTKDEEALFESRAAEIERASSAFK